MARDDCAYRWSIFDRQTQALLILYRWSIFDRQTQALLILYGLPDRINKGGVSWLVFSARG